MKKLAVNLLFTIFIFCFSVVIFSGCGAGSEPPEGQNYRRLVTVETDLPKLRIGNIYLDANTVYPYTLLDNWDSIEDFIEYFSILPVRDKGFIKLKLYSGKGYYKPSVSLKDSLIINTPIDTTLISISFYHFIK